MEQQETKTKLQTLYDELKKEMEGKDTSSRGFIAPSAYSYYRKVQALVDEAINISKRDGSLANEHILHSFEKEVLFVRDYEGKGGSAKNRQKGLETAMRIDPRQLFY